MFKSFGTKVRRTLFLKKEGSPMGLFAKDIKSMDDLFLHGLQDIYYAENEIIKALPKMIEHATNRDVEAGLRLHLDETKKQVERLDKVFEKLGKRPSGADCPAIDGIISVHLDRDDGRSAMGERDPDRISTA
jgi:ferritin-like metal-binding protein YciE